MNLNGKIILKGVGLHSGGECRLTIEPHNSTEIIISTEKNESPVSRLKLNGTNRGSDYIFNDGETVKTCEHVLSALNGMGIYSGVKLTVEGGEMPALDGCSKLLSNEILNHSENSEIERIPLTQSAMVYSEDRKRFVGAYPCDHLHITYTVEYEFIGTQIFDYDHSSGNYYENISSARTFAMKSDIEYLRSYGMALGGNLDNAIVVGEEIQASGGLNWPDEFVRHKILDLIGDMAAVGKPFNAHLIAVRAGHELHLKLAEKLREILRGE